jgi:rubrerythrin
MKESNEFVCANCGFTSEKKFADDICPECGQTFWKCSKCGYLLTANVPPAECPSCKEKCLFNNVTCYTPECGGPGNIDPRL